MLYEVMCIATAIYFEARGEPIDGQYAVGQVIMNRTQDPRYPSDACSVVYDGGEALHECAFSFYCDGKSDQPNLNSVDWDSAQRVAKAVYEGRSAPVVGEATHYHAKRVHPDWVLGSHVVATIDNHIFYKGVK